MSPGNGFYVSFDLIYLVEKDRIYTRHSSKRTSKLPQLQNLHLDLLTITFLAIYKDIHRTLIIDGMNNTFR